MSELRFVVHGRMTSSNHFKAPDWAAKQMRKTKEAREDSRRVHEIAVVAVSAQSWEIPDAVAVELWAWNSALDADNASKVPFDSLKGLVWRDDKDVLDFTVRRRWDRGGERYEIVVSPTTDHRPGASGRKGRGATTPTRVAETLRSGDVLTFEQRDALLQELGVR